MFIELVDSLRCPRAHEEEGLIASAIRMVARHILDGELGCPACHARFPIVDGVAHFGEPERRGQPIPASTEDAWRIAALLELAEAGGFVVLAGSAAVHAEGVRSIAPHVAIVLVNPPPEVEPRPGISILLCGPVLPLRDATARGAAVEDASGVAVEELARALKPGGRLLAPSTLALPSGMTRVAGDERHVISFREASAAVHPLKRARPQ